MPDNDSLMGRFDRFEEDKDSLARETKTKMDDADRLGNEKVADVRKQEALLDLIQGLTKIGAGAYGIKKGLAINPEFKTPDWERRIDRLKDDLNREKNRIKGSERDAISSLRDRLSMEVRQEEGAKTRAFQAGESEKDRKFKSEQAEDKRIHDIIMAEKKAPINKGPGFKDYRMYDSIIRVYDDGSTEDLVKGRVVDQRGRTVTLAEERFEHSKEEKDEPSPPDVRMMGGFEETKALLKQIKADKMEGGIDTGPVANIRNLLAQQVGVDDPEVTTLKQSLVETLANKVKTLSGTAASDKEREHLKFTLPQLKDNDKTFLKKLDVAIRNLELAKKSRLDVIQKAGRNVESLQTPPETKTVGGVTYEKVEGGWKKVSKEQ